MGLFFGPKLKFKVVIKMAVHNLTKIDIKILFNLIIQHVPKNDKNYSIFSNIKAKLNYVMRFEKENHLTKEELSHLYAFIFNIYTNCIKIDLSKLEREITNHYYKIQCKIFKLWIDI